MLTTVFAGCENGFRIGGWTIIKPRGPLAATHVQIDRTQSSAAAVQGAGRSTMVIDLLTGHCTLTDAQGRVHPSQLKTDTAQRIEHIVAERLFMTGASKPTGGGRVAGVGGVDGGGGADVMKAASYELTVYDADRAVARPVRWAVLSAKELPDELAVFTQAFNRADRMAHPVSKSINLLQ